MISNDYEVTSPYTNSILDLFNNDAKQINDLTAVAVFGVANIAFFNLAQSFGNWINWRIEAHPRELNDDQILVKNILVNVIKGGSILSLNLILSQAIGYPG